MASAKNILPKFHKWVDQQYPSTKVSISEYGWGDMKKLTNAVAEADVLGIYGRDGVDLACLWDCPKAGDIGANALRVYLNYDGKGSRYGDTFVHSISADQGRVSVYAAVRWSDHALTAVVINKSDGALVSRVKVSGFDPVGAAHVFRFGGEGAKALAPLADQPVGHDGFEASFPPRSVTLFVLEARP